MQINLMVKVNDVFRFPKIFDDPTVGGEARTLYDEAQSMLATVIADASPPTVGIDSALINTVQWE